MRFEIDMKEPISVEKPGLFNFCAQFLNGCILISINYEVNLKITKKLQLAVFVSLFQEHLKKIPGVEFCWLSAICWQLELTRDRAS